MYIKHKIIQEIVSMVIAFFGKNFYSDCNNHHSCDEPLAKRKVDGLSFKTGPTQSGIAPTPTPTPTSLPVGGEIVGIDTLAVFLSKYWPLLLLLLVPIAFALYKRRIMFPKWFLRLMYQIKGI
ncbi:MAG: hypothetical protein QXU99_06280 [Candidatus Bathyarchaeia archaeon]